MIAVTHFASDAADFDERARLALRTLAARPGYVRGSLGRCIDDPAAWVLVTEWENVGSYRRALGNYEVKLYATPLLGEALDIPGGFEPLSEVAPGGEESLRASDREPGV
ncbi:antibiotic biosynthesis monooxygenase family protein [Jatrophihabitans fulvus]